MKIIYIFSGLGVDKRIFQNIEFENCEPKFIEWIAPEKNETIENYSTRLIKQITTQKPILLGVSFGGIIATEIGKQIETEKLILISSAQTKYEIPKYYRLAGKLKLNKLLPTKILKQSNFITNWFFGTETQEEKLVLKKILHDTDNTFLFWAIDKIANWKNESKNKITFIIHGTRDRILPIRNITFDKQIKSGGHFMIWNKAKELNKIINEQI